MRSLFSSLLLLLLASTIGARWVWNRGRLYRVYMKLDPERRVQTLWSAYRVTGEIPSLGRSGRKRVGVSDEERRIVKQAYARYEVNALTLERAIEAHYHKHVPHDRIHAVLKGMGLARDEPRKRVRKKWIRYERKHSNSLWHTDWTLIDGKGWLISRRRHRSTPWRCSRKLQSGMRRTSARDWLAAERL